MIKQFSAGDINIRPFKTFKNWEVQSVDVNGTDRFGCSTYFLSSSQVNRGREIDTIFYPSGSPKYDSIAEPMTNGLYQRNIYSLTDAMFYKNAGNPTELFGVENGGQDLTTGRKEVREIRGRVVALRLFSNFWGEKVVPESVKIVDRSNFHNTYEIYDDGFTNLYITGSHFSTDQRVQAPTHLPPISYWNSASAQFYTVINNVTQPISYAEAVSLRDMGVEVTYTEDTSSNWLWNVSQSRDYFEPESERFGQAVSTWYKYVAVGSPMDSMSLSPERQGYAAIFKYDEVQSQHRLVKRFYSVKDQGSLATEFGTGSSVLLRIEDNEFLDLETGSFVDEFGYAVAVGDNFLAIGAPSGSMWIDSGSHAGFVCVYDKNKGGLDNWGIVNVLQGATENDRFGHSLSIDGDTLAVGAPGVSGSTGAVYIFRRKCYMDSNNPCQSVPTSSFWQIVGNYDLPLVPTPTFVSGNYTWVYETGLTSSAAQPLDKFGSVLEVNSNRLIVGNRKTSGPGFATLFACSYISASLGDCPTASWTENTTYHGNASLGDLPLTSSDYSIQVPLSYDGFGWTVSLSEENMVIGSYYDKGFLPYNGAPTSSTSILGAVYFYHYHYVTCDTSSFVDYFQIQKTFGDRSKPTCNLFGRKVAIDGLNAAVASDNTFSRNARQVDYISGSFILESASYQSTGSNDAVLGRVSMYALQPDFSWVHVGEIQRNKETQQPFNVFGRSVSLSSDFLAIGAPIYNFVGPSSSYSSSIDHNIQISGSFPSEYSGSVFVYDLENYETNPLIGNMFYRNGYAVVTSTASNYENIFTGTGSAGFDLTYQGTHTIFEHEYLVSIRPGEFNYSTNPSSLMENPMLFDVNLDGIFDFSDVNLIMRYLNKKRFFEEFVFDDDGIEVETDNLKGHQWWDNKLLIAESEDVVMQESPFATYLASSSFTAFTKKVFDYIEVNLVQTNILDIDGDGKVDLNDGAILAAFFTARLTPAALTQWITSNSIRRYVKDVTAYIGQYTGAQRHFTDPAFFGYQVSCSYDPTGSYLAPVITTIGLYDNSNHLLAVGKLGKPIKNLVDWPLNFIIRFDT